MPCFVRGCTFHTTAYLPYFCKHRFPVSRSAAGVRRTRAARHQSRPRRRCRVVAAWCWCARRRHCVAAASPASPAGQLPQWTARVATCAPVASQSAGVEAVAPSPRSRCSLVCSKGARLFALAFAPRGNVSTRVFSPAALPIEHSQRHHGVVHTAGSTHPACRAAAAT